MINWIQPSRGRPAGANANTTRFRLSNQKGGGKHRTQAAIFIHEKTMKELRWVVGDRVVFADDGEALYMKRVPNMGFSLSAAKGGKAKEYTGQMVSVTVKSSTHLFSFDGTKYVDEFTIEGDVIKIIYKEK